MDLSQIMLSVVSCITSTEDYQNCICAHYHRIWPKGLELLVFTKQIIYNLLTQIYSFNTARL